MLEILLSSSALIAVLALLRLFLRDKISARLQYALWLLVLARLLVPVSLFQSPVSVAQAAAPVVTRVERLSGAPLGPERTVVTTAGGGPASVETVPAWTLEDAARYVWVAGMAAMAAWFLTVNARMARRLRRSRAPYDVSAVPPVYVAEGIPSPCLFGLVRPAIYLTEQAASDPAQARQIVAHERTHLRHGDMIWALLRSVCLVVWWFDPLVWLAAALSRRDCELACDEGTIRALGEGARFDYGRTLVGMARVSPGKPSDLLCGATTMTTGRKSLKERVARIARAPKTSAAVAALVLVIAAAAVGCTFSGASDAETASDADGEVLGTYDRDYWDEVRRELWSFTVADMDVYVAGDFDETLPEDDPLGPMSLGEYIYSTDSWRFTYNGEPMANDPRATIKLHDADGRTLWIMDDADALMIEEADGSVTWVDYAGEPVDCAGMIRRLLPWARGEYDPDAARRAAEAERQDRFAELEGVLGDYDIPGLTLSTADADNAVPMWDMPEGYGMMLLKFYGSETQSVDLAYYRFWTDEGRTVLSNAEAFRMARAFYAQTETITDGLSVNGCEAFLSDGEDYGRLLMWYDADAELIFSLTAGNFSGGEFTGFPSPEELLALAESVTAA